MNNKANRQGPPVEKAKDFKGTVKKLIKYNRKNFRSLKDESLKNKVYIIRQNIKYSIKFKSWFLSTFFV